MSAARIEPPGDEHAMLCLALLSYRGFSSLDPLSPSAERVRAGVERGLDELPLVKGAWELVWGPVGYQAPFSSFDDSLMYVVKHRTANDRYAVVVRGTNPISRFDWLFGDLWVGMQTKWPYGAKTARGAKVSLSTSLGLSILDYMRSPPRRTGPAAHLWRTVVKEVGAFARDVRDAVLRPIAERIGSPLRRIRNELRPAVDEIAARQRERRRMAPEMLLASIVDDWKSKRAKGVFSLVGHALDALGDGHALNLLRLLEGGARLRAARTDGLDLVSFLKGAVRVAEGEVDVAVTGHSKGGALASAVALRLADSRGNGASIAEEDAWDPDGRATVRCYSYAAPTAGNKRFASRFDKVLGNTSVRVASSLDVVPHAWTDEHLGKIPGLYAPRVGGLPLLEELIGEIRAQLREHQYTQVLADAQWLECEVDKHKKLYFKQLVHQHLDGYLRTMKLSPQISQRTFFDLLA